MRRTEMIELHDHPRFPAFLRDLVTDALEALWGFGNSYKPVLGRLKDGFETSRESRMQVVDLCSGGGGPWMRMALQMEELGRPVEVRLTDKYPNAAAFARIEAKARFKQVDISFARGPVDALRVPCELRGFRTMFSAFHHFGPTAAREVLASAVESGQGIGVFEVAQRGPKTMLVLCFTPLLVMLLTPWMRPFRWARLFWTYVVPVVPFVIGFDGWASCFRAYSQEELREMVSGMSEYRWEIGEERSGLLPVTYLVGVPDEGSDARCNYFTGLSAVKAEQQGAMTG